MNNNNGGKKKRTNALYYSLAVCVVACFVAAFSIFGSAPAGGDTSNMNSENQNEDVKVAAPVTDVPDTRSENVSNKVSGDNLNSTDEVTTQTSSTVSELDMNIPYESVYILPLSTEISWDYSDGEFVFSKLHGDYRQHNGVDFTAEAGNSVLAIISGEVTGIINDDEYGTIVEINHGNKLLARYCGLGKVAVSKGDFIEQGAKIGTVGTVPIEGETPHIHFETLIDGAYTDPLAVMGKAGIESENNAETTAKTAKEK